MNSRNYLSIAIVLVSLSATAQPARNKAAFIENENKFYKEIKKQVELFNQGETKPATQTFKMDYTNVDVPHSAAEFTTVWAGDPVSQGMTNTCWCFSTTSFYESEVKRLSGKEVRLSEQYIVYYEFLDKARMYVRTRGTSFFGEGSETNAVARMMERHGMVPYDSYTGYRTGQKFLDHSVMFAEMEKYLASVKEQNAWNEELVVSTIGSMLDHYMGKVPDHVIVDGKKLTPLEYMKNILKINPADYVDFMSLMEKPFWTKTEYDVPDNWWNSTDYYNVPVEDFMNILKSSLKKGYSISIGGDVSESGLIGSKGVAMVPTYDIPSEYIDDYARQLRFTNGSTTDDHAMHLVGWAEKPNGTWFLLKDSGSGAHNNPVSKGYYYFHEDFVRLKMMSFTIHKDAVKEILQKFQKS